MSCNLCSMCGKTELCGVGAPNYAKLVDPYPKLYSTILGDEPPQNPFRNPNIQIPSFQFFVSPGRGVQPPYGLPHQHLNQVPYEKPCIINVPCDNVRPPPKIICEPCPPPSPTKVWLIKSSPTPQKSFAIAQPPPIPFSEKTISIPGQPPC